MNLTDAVMPDVMLYMVTFKLSQYHARLCSEMFCCYDISEVTRSECIEFLKGYFENHPEEIRKEI